MGIRTKISNGVAMMQSIAIRAHETTAIRGAAMHQFTFLNVVRCNTIFTIAIKLPALFKPPS